MPGIMAVEDSAGEEGDDATHLTLGNVHGGGGVVAEHSHAEDDKHFHHGRVVKELPVLEHEGSQSSKDDAHSYRYYA